MKKIMKRIVSVLLVVIILISTFSSCADALKRDYMIRGEFFSLVLSELNYYPINNTVEEMQEADNYDIEAQTMVDWDLLPEEEALKDLLKPITKEIVLVVLLNSMYFTKEGDPETIKDAKMCKYPKEVADAVATGIAELEDGKYINAKQKLTREECEDLIEKSRYIDTNSHFEDEGTIGYDFGGNAAVLSPDDILNDPYFEVGESYEGVIEESETANLSQDEFEKPSVSFLVVNSLAETKNLNNEVENVKELIPVTMGKDIYNKIINNNEKNGNDKNVIVYDPYLSGLSSRIVSGDVSLPKNIKPFSGKIVNVIDLFDKVNLVLEKIDDETIMANTDVKESHLKTNISSKEKALSLISDKKLSYNGFKIGFDYDPTTEMYTFSASKNLTVGDPSLWSNSTFSPKLTVSASIGAFETDLNNVKYLFRKNSSFKSEKTLVHFSFKTSQSASLEMEGRYAPANNGNGKALSNLGRSRWTNGKGADVIKLCKINVPLGTTGITVDIVVYLRVTFEGEMEIVFSQTSGFDLYKSKNGLRLVQIKDSSNEIDLKATLRLALGVDICLNFTLVKNIMVYEIEGYLKLLIESQVYNNNKKTLEKTINDDTSNGENSLKIDLSMFEGLSNEYGYYLHLSLYFGVDGYMPEKTAVGGCSNLLYKVIGEKAAKKISFHWEREKPIYDREWGTKLSDEKTAEYTKNKQNTEIQLESTKMHVPESSFDYNKIVSIPKQKDVLKTSDKIKIDVKDSDIAKVTIAETKDTIMLVVIGVKQGSTEFEVYYQDNKTSKKKYSQTVSVTVEENEDKFNSLLSAVKKGESLSVQNFK